MSDWEPEDDALATFHEALGPGAILMPAEEPGEVIAIVGGRGLSIRLEDIYRDPRGEAARFG